MKRIVAAFAAALLCAGGATAVPADGPDQAIIEGSTLPRKLSDFGLFRRGTAELANGVAPYDLHTPLFSDYADKARGIWLPAGGKAQVRADGTIDFPRGTVLVKSFSWPGHNGGRPVETRLLIHRSDGWVALPYVWDADGSDATLAVGGRRLPVDMAGADGAARTISYAVPNKNQCKECHSEKGSIVPIGPKARNLMFAPAWQGFAAGRFAWPAQRPASLPRWDDPASGSVAERARAYLDVNCAHCHNPAGSASNSGLFLRWTDDPAGVNYGIEKRPTAAGRGSGGMEFAIRPGHPEQSFLLYRLESLDPGIAMPEVGRVTVHREGQDLLRQWIAEMPESKH
ncbi:MAG: SO2930 family diheme c-type cytochrome [Sphingopyxis sp.]|uniref:SO2930 family diheme c-type cytochrome n=1 Tax=Sphingopyxis sp. TaxID=1908224 RepID=UPI002ABC1FEB|nr:SO2930 family diheme c-type cytochrome [Sphingopyxis sp.]MDZ3831081.1 SO2930 family diheme c-type cytochrome [Sphingopyxis sp.]